MKNYIYKIINIRNILFICLLSCTTYLFSACSNKSGCPANEDAHIEFDPNKPFKKNKTKSGLLSPKQRKKMRGIRGK